MRFSADYFRDLVHGRQRGLGASLQRAGLDVVSRFYGVVVAVRNRLYDWRWRAIHEADVPVVSVGNLTLGGTGKTPCVEYVSRLYREQGLQVAILSRGFGGETGPNDEALVLEESLPDVPHLQGADRVALARIAVEELESEILVLDDGFQHRRLKRVLDIVLLDTTDPWGAGRIFPRGLLRESPRSLARADVVILTRCDQVDAAIKEDLRRQIAALAPRAIVAETSHRPLQMLRWNQPASGVALLNGASIIAFCGIGNPESFRRTLVDAGARVLAFRTFPDHHAYGAADVEDLRGWAGKQAMDCLVVTTQKDLVKLRLPNLGGLALWALRVGLHFEAGQQALDQKLLEAVRIA
ncbi:MAG TPA: tetraacyldisaccharide 4'-kinase [Gemmataceae bacterium]|nr:tetraacyldisaccharide 4'-kinase [Gemmataceae bacterium]